MSRAPGLLDTGVVHTAEHSYGDSALQNSAVDAAEAIVLDASEAIASDGYSGGDRVGRSGRR